MWCGVNYICGVACEFFWGLLSFCLASGLKFFRPFRAWPMGGHVRGLTRPGYYRAGPPGQFGRRGRREMLKRREDRQAKLFTIPTAPHGSIIDHSPSHRATICEPQNVLTILAVHGVMASGVNPAWVDDRPPRRAIATEFVTDLLRRGWSWRWGGWRAIDRSCGRRRRRAGRGRGRRDS